MQGSDAAGAAAAVQSDAELNGPQADAVVHVDGPMVVFAGAGSGKTRVITYRIANLVATARVPPYRILAVTFTNKAAGEMKRRLERILGPEIVRDLWVGTFHATCARLLRRYHEAAGLERSFTIYDDDDQRAVMNRIYKELRIDDRRYPPRDVLGRIHREKQEGVTAAEFHPDRFGDEVVARCFSEYDRRLADANAVDFDDLLVKVLRIAEDMESSAGDELRRRFSHVLVDEFQDVNRVQYRLVRALTRRTKNLFVVGDDDQSIYRWRGADVRIVRNFKKDHPEAKVVKLEENYRSSGNVVAAALAVIRPAQDREPKELFTQNPDGDKVAVVACATERDEAAYVAERIRELLERGVSPDEIAIFYRVHAQSRVLEEVLRAERIPYQVVGGVRFFERAEVKDLVSYLRVLVNPKSDVDLVRIINVPSRKIGDTTVERLAQMAGELKKPMFDAILPLCGSDRIGPQPKKALARFHAMMTEIAEHAKTGSPREIAERVLVESGYEQMLKDENTDESEGRLMNLQELVGSIAEHEIEVLAAGEVPSLAGWLEKVALTATIDEMKDAPRVAMMTVHAAKGLEFSAVFLTGMEEDMFPFRSQDPSGRADLEEERRLAYVAVTRARHKLFVFHAERRMVFGGTKYGLPSRFLADLPAPVVDAKKTEVLRASFGRFIDRPAWSAEPPRPGAGATAPKLAWSHPQGKPAPAVPAPMQQRSLFDDGLPVRPAFSVDEGAPSPRGRAGGLATRRGPDRSVEVEPGERYVERDDDAPAAIGSGLGRRAAAAAATVRAGGLRRGSKVVHKQFGVGVVVDVDEAPDPTATVKFSGWTDKRIKVRFLQLLDDAS